MNTCVWHQTKSTKSIQYIAAFLSYTHSETHLDTFRVGKKSLLFTLQIACELDSVSETAQ